MGMGRLGEANFRCGEAGFPPKALDELRGKDYVCLPSPEPSLYVWEPWGRWGMMPGMVLPHT